ncbi:MAG: hypothetical protein WBM14_03340, partial [Terracidiphilus sp.]
NRPEALVVPSAAIQTGLHGSFVWVIDTDAKGVTAARIAPVKVALAEGQVTILDSGPAPGANVVVDGADRLRPAQVVEVSMAHPHTAQGTEQAPAQSGLFAAPGTQPAAQPGAQTGTPAAKGKTNGKHPQREKP